MRIKSFIAFLLLLLVTVVVTGQITVTSVTTDFEIASIDKDDADAGKLVLDSQPFLMWDNRIGSIFQDLYFCPDSLDIKYSTIPRRWEYLVTSKTSGMVICKVISKIGSAIPTTYYDTLLAQSAVKQYNWSIIDGIDATVQKLDSIDVGDKACIYVRQSAYANTFGAYLGTFSGFPILRRTLSLTQLAHASGDTIWLTPISNNYSYKNLLIDAESEGDFVDSILIKVIYQLKDNSTSQWLKAPGDSSFLAFDNVRCLNAGYISLPISTYGPTDSIKFGFVSKLDTILTVNAVRAAFSR